MTLRFAMFLNEYELKCMLKEIQKTRGCPYIVMSETDARDGLDFHFQKLILFRWKLDEVRNWEAGTIRTKWPRSRSKVFLESCL